jgi:CheY-like chemotaxis protein/PAS domain-containing protein
MSRRSPEVPASFPALFASGYFYALCALGGVIAALSLFLMFSYGENLDRRQLAEEQSRHSVVIAHTAMRRTWDRAAFWADRIAWQLGAANTENIPALLSQYHQLLPDVGISLFGRDAKLIPGLAPDLGGVGSAPIEALPGLKAMLHRALEGESTQDYTRYRGFLSLGAAAPTQGKTVRAVVLSVPLDSDYLENLKLVAGSNIIAAPLDERGSDVLGSLADAGNTFTGETRPPSWDALKKLVKTGILHEEAIVLPDEADLPTSAIALVNRADHPMGVLLATPIEPIVSGVPFWHYTLALSGGLVTSLLLALFLRFRERRMAAAVAGDVYSLSRNVDAPQRNAWPPALTGALNKIADDIREYKQLLRNAVQENARMQHALGNNENGVREREGADYQRLFDNLPVGAFQAYANGNFIRVNTAFALLLGYDSPISLLTSCVSFADLCLYGEGVRNPLGALLEKGGGRHVLSLRRRDGKVRHYAVICQTLTSDKGDQSDVLEGFLLDRELEERLGAAEREKRDAEKNRESLALLLAATCLQTRSYFTPPKGKLPAQGEEAGRRENAPQAAPAPSIWPEFKILAGSVEGAASEDDGEPADDRNERRKSVLSIKAVLSDIYQIAITEADAAPPLEMPIEFRAFMKRLCRQALPTLFSRGISLRCEIAEDLLTRMHGPAPLLRHALLRALLTVTGPAQGGWACLSVTRDPNSPSMTGVARLLFSASWSSFDREGKAVSAPEEGFVVFAAEVDAEAPGSSDQPIAAALDIGDEQSVLRYLALKLRGQLLDGVFGKDLRSLQLVVPLEKMSDNEGDGPAVAPLDTVARVEDLTIAPLEELSPPPPNMAQAIWISPRLAEAWNPDGEHAADSLEAETVDAVEAEEEGLPEETPAAPDLNILVMDDAGADHYSGAENLDPTGGVQEAVDAASRSMNILLIDASLNNRQLFSLFLKDASHRITEAHDGQTGVEAFQRGNYDIIFMDMEMPLMDGYQATRIIRALEADQHLPPTPIVGMTSYALPELRRECMLAGCSEFLSRPFSKNALLTLLGAFAGLERKND